MTLKFSHLSFISDLRPVLPKLRADLGTDWPRFSQYLVSLTERFMIANDPREQETIIYGLVEHVRTVCGQLPYILELIPPEDKHLGPGWGAATRGGESHTDFVVVGSPVRGIEPKEISIGVELLTPFTDALLTDLKSLNDEHKPRYFNAFFTRKDTKEMVPLNEPLLLQPYYLDVEINPQKRGPGEEDIFVDSAVQDAQTKGETIPLLVVASSREFEIKPRVISLDLPADGPTKQARFSVTPLTAGEMLALQVEIFYRGHLLQVKRLEARVVSDESSDIPVSLRPLQCGRIIFATTERFSADTLSLIPERVLAIDVERDPKDQSVVVRFLDRTHGENQLAIYDTLLEPQALGAAVDGVREGLKTLVKGENRNGKRVDGYEWVKEGKDPMLLNWLPYLADLGRTLYRKLLPQEQHKSQSDQGERLKAALRPGAAIQINPVAGKVTIPWSILYERNIFLHQNRLCSKYPNDGPECPECESRSNPAVVCPSGFWGYRYAIEQLPCWVSNESPNPLALSRQISNGKPLLLNLNVWRDFQFWRDHKKKLEAAANITMLPAEDLGKVAEIWQSHSHELDVLYFYTHGGTHLQQPYLEVSDGGRVVSNTLNALLEPGTLKHNPLVFLNGCATGDYGPQSFVSLIDDFREAGACGVIGTECAVPELFAEEYATRLFQRFFHAECLGQAMLELRRDFLINYKNPLALVYSLYASNEISLTSPVNNSQE